eukprot:6043393-Pyramimonas_sp.AAC.1
MSRILIAPSPGDCLRNTYCCLDFEQLSTLLHVTINTARSAVALETFLLGCKPCDSCTSLHLDYLPHGLLPGVLLQVACCDLLSDMVIEGGVETTIGSEELMDLAQYNQELHQLANSSNLDGALSLFNKLRASGVKPNVTTFNHLFRACKKV